MQLSSGQEGQAQKKLNAKVLGVSTNHGASQKVFGEQLKLDYPLLSAFEAPDVITNYAGWLDKDKRLSNRAYFVIDKEGIVRFKKVMEKPREILPTPELEKALEGLP
ncbi:MAG: redoxin domain-containing protein [Deltaproteobacteria bacterium]|nr:redoxin domain-containing protein [Deltaproteobacteria bacterium]